MPDPGWYDDPQGAGQLRWWSGRDWTEHVAERPDPNRPRPAPPRATSAPKSARSSERSWPHGVALGAAAVIVIGCFLPWAKIGVVTMSGTDTNDWIYFVVAAVVVVWATLLQTRPWPLAVVGAVTTILWFGAHNDMDDRGRALDFDLGVTIGIGLWLILLAALAVLVSGVTLFLRAQDPPPDADQRPPRGR